MVILHVYLKAQGNVVATMPFRYNNGDDTPIEAREVVLDIDAESTYDSIRQALMEKFDKEKQDGEDNSIGQPGMGPYITVV
jgi:hypothetical protein